MEELEHIYFKNNQDFRNWLKGNFDKSPGIWMIFYKKHVKAEGVTYSEALDEALCFGWIDSIVKKIDDEKYVRKFSPRKDISNWSDVNKAKVISLIKQGKMTDEGLKKIDVYIETGKVGWNLSELKEKDNQPIEIPDFFRAELSENEPALENFLNLAKSYQKQYIGWITDAKREETTLKRMNEAVSLLKQNKRLGMK